MHIWISMILSLSLASASAVAKPTEFSSGKHQVQVIELFTSEGCSSCPPADNWLRQFKSNPDLWKHVIPLAFHVDYWNYLGWPDKFANTKNTKRQYDYKRSGNIGSVYTPGFVVDGKEWRRWFSSRRLPASNSTPGVLSVTVDEKQLSANYLPEQESPDAGSLILNVALLGFDIERKIRGGENSGRTLIHDFIVLNHFQVQSSNKKWAATLPEVENPEAMGIAVWVSTPYNQAPLQATGGWLASN